jgi:MFS family permease
MGEGKANPGGERWYFAFFFSKMAGGASAPLVPLFVITVLGGGVAEVTMAIVSVSMATVPAFILWGEYTDRRGSRRLPLVVGMAMTAVSFAIMGLAEDMAVFVLANVLYGFFLAATVPTSTILIMEHNSESRWGEAVGLFTKVSGMGWMLGMVVGAVFFFLATPHFGIVMAMRAFMGMCALLSAIAWVMVTAWVKEPRTRMDRRWLGEEVAALRTWAFERSRHIPAKLIYVLRPRVIRKARLLFPAWGRELDVYLLATLIMFIGIQVFYVPFPVMLTGQLRLSSAQVFSVYLASALASALMYAWAGKEIDRLGNQRSQLLAWGLRAMFFPMFSFALMAMALDLPMLAFATVLVLNGLIGSMFSIVSVAGVTTAMDLAPRQARGEALGAYNAVTGLGMIAGGVLGGIVATLGGYFTVAITTGFLTLVAMALVRRVSLSVGEST